MPYISQDRRKDFDVGINALPETASSGELNFLISTLCNLHLGVSPGYESFNEVIGILECAKLELYRRLVAPYEDKKKEQNGDVY